jgi:hypothetical protein
MSMPKLTVTDERSRKKVTNASRTYRRYHGHGSPIVFHGVDTEGTGTGSDHKPVLLSCGSQHIASASGLKWYDVFDFLYSQFQPGGHAYVGFYLAYDFTKWLESLPESRAVMLLTEYGKAARKGKTKTGQDLYFPVRCAGWEFDMLGSKRLKIRPATCRDKAKCPHPHTPTGTGHRWMYVCDVGPFFQTSFLKAIHPENWPEPIVTRDEYDRIEEGKGMRDVATLGDAMIMYQQAEIRALESLMDAQQDGLRDMGVFLKPKQWFGPGQIAQELLKRWDVPTIDELTAIVPDEWQYCAQASYFGGWFEIFAHGHVKKAWSYDINSAYPHIIAQLPCLRHGRYSSGRGNPHVGERELCIVRASVRRTADLGAWDPDNPGDIHIGAMLHRDKQGRIFRPLSTSGYYWLHELRAAERAGCVEAIEYHEWARFEPGCDCPSPLREIIGLYDWRLKVGKNTPLGKALKNGYNSIYGKLAQSVGSPKYANAIYASLITAGCRTMILDAIATHPSGQKAVLMVATDGVYFSEHHPSLPLSKKLGEWEEEEHDNLTLFKPGVYWDDSARRRIRDGKAPQFKARGVAVRDFAKSITEIDDQYSLWPKNSAKNLCNRPQWQPKGTGWPTVKVRSSFSMVSMTQALARGKWDTAGYVETAPEIMQSAAHKDKRHGLWWDPQAGFYRSAPRWDQGLLGDISSCPESVMYAKKFGREDPWSDEMKESAGITPDGPVAEQLAVVLSLGT